MTRSSDIPAPGAGRGPGQSGLDSALEALRTELAALREAVCDHSRDFCRDLDGRRLLAVFRLFPDLTDEDFRSLAREPDLAGWLSLPVDRQAYPHLARLQGALEDLAFQADHDPLTGLANRRALERALDMEMERARRDKTALSLVVLDLDDFKAVNDSHGHPAGDAVLVALAGILKSGVRRYDTAARLGGEEFALLLPGIGRTKAGRLVGRILKALEEMAFETPDAVEFSITASAGLAAYRGTPDMPPARLMELADKALYQAKAAGKNRLNAAPAPDPDPALRRTLVRASEKRFLFTGQAHNEDETP